MVAISTSNRWIQPYHPVTLLISFLSIVFINIFIFYPLVNGLSLILSLALMVYFKQINRKQLFSYLFLFIVIAFSNPIFVLKGATVLFYYFGRPYTLEALVYGVVFASMLVSLLLWGHLFGMVFTSDHIVYLFSKPFSSLGMLVSVVFRLVPKFKRRFHEVHMYHRKHFSGHPLKQSFDLLMMMFTWAFESSIDMVDSMSARGYSTKRSHFHRFFFRKEDGYLIGSMILIDSVLLVYHHFVFSEFYYYPQIKAIVINGGEIFVLVLFVVLCLLPILWIKGGKN